MSAELNSREAIKTLVEGMQRSIVGFKFCADDVFI